MCVAIWLAIWIIQAKNRRNWIFHFKFDFYKKKKWILAHIFRINIMYIDLLWIFTISEWLIISSYTICNKLTFDWLFLDSLKDTFKPFICNSGTSRTETQLSSNIDSPTSSLIIFTHHTLRKGRMKLCLNSRKKHEIQSKFAWILNEINGI
jgi:hypothetical protein